MQTRFQSRPLVIVFAAFLSGCAIQPPQSPPSPPPVTGLPVAAHFISPAIASKAVAVAAPVKPTVVKLLWVFDGFYSPPMLTNFCTRIYFSTNLTTWRAVSTNICAYTNSVTLTNYSAQGFFRLATFPR
jgi:hypothetical protein